MRAFRTLPYLLAAGSLLLCAEEPQRIQSGQDPELQVQGGGDRDDTPGLWPPAGPGGRPIRDNARLRAEAMRQWWGDWSPGFRRFMLDAAAQERRAHDALMPWSGGKERPVAAPATGTWANIGPTKADVIKNGGTSLAKTDSGRPRSICVDPANAQVIYLCTSGGGVWKTNDGGSSWTPITETLGSLSCGYLAMDPSDSQVLYLGLGDPFDGTGVGLVKTTNGGASWGSVVTLGASKTIQSILVHPTNPNIVMVATNTGLFRSTDGGASFAAVASINAAWKAWDLAHAGGGSFVLTVETDPANANGASAGQVYRSTDDGVTWAVTSGIAATSTRISVASAPGNRAVMYAMASKSDNNLDALYKSTNGGATWSTISSTGITDILGGQGFYNHLVLVDRTNPDVVYLGGQLYIAKSTSGGGSWSKKSDWLAQGGLPYVHADMHAAAQDAAGSLLVGSDGGIFKSTDGATTWTDALNIGVTSHLIYSIGSSPAAPDAVIGGFQDNGTRVRKGSTSTFDQQIGGDGFGSLMHPSISGTMLGSLYYTRVYKSTNGGTSFSTASTGITESNNTSSAPFITRLAPGPADATGNTVYTFVNAKVYKSTNYAGSWTAMGVTGLPTTSFVIRNVGAAKSSTSVVGIAANSGRVFLTANGGSSWSQAAALPNNGSYTSSVAFDPTDYNTVYVSSVAPDASKNHIWKSSNFGGSWTAVDGSGLPTGVPVNVVTVDPGDRNVVYAATHLGLYRSGDSGTSWTRWGSGLPLVNVTDVWVAPDSSKVRIATYGRGFWELQGSVTAPAISTQPQNATVTAGATASFTVTATGSAPLAYQWRKNGTGISGATTAAYTTPATTTADNGATFSVVVSNSAGSVTSNNATLTVNNTAPSITGQPQNATVAAGATATFTVTAGGTAPLAYQWRKNGTNIAGATAASYTTPATTSADNGATFSVVVSNSAGSVTSNNATLTVNSAPIAPSITGQPQNATVAAGATATFTVTAGGTAPLAYQWRKNGTNLAGATAASYTTPATTSADNGATFSVVVSNSAGSATSNNATLTVTSVPPPTTFNEVEPNDTIATANAVASTYTTIVGYHPATGNQDHFAVTLAAGEKLTVNMTGPSGPDWDLYLYTAAGAQLAKSEGSTCTEAVTYTNPGSTSLTIYIRVLVYSGTSSSPYNLALTRTVPPPSSTYNEVEANNSTAAANAVPDAATKVVGYISSSTDNDYFKLNVGAGRTLRIAMTGPTGTGYDYDLYFYNASGVELAKGTGSTTTETVSWTNTGASTAVVTVAVKRYAGSSTTVPYNLNLTR